MQSQQAKILSIYQQAKHKKDDEISQLKGYLFLSKEYYVYFITCLTNTSYTILLELS